MIAVGVSTMDDETKGDRQRCPHDGAECHHNCAEGKCFRKEVGAELSSPWPGYPLPVGPVDTYPCTLVARSEKPATIDAPNASEAAQAYAMSLWYGVAHHNLFDSENVRRAYFYKVRVNDEVLVARVWHHGIFRKGGVPRANAAAHKRHMADDLGLPVEELLVDRWECEDE